MGSYPASLITQLLVCSLGLIICLLTQVQAQAADGDILISRQVQPRAAARQELMPDPNPQRVNPDHSQQIRDTLTGAHTAMEISDSDFASVSSGSTLTHGLHIFAHPVERPAGTQAPGRSAMGVTGTESIGRAVGGVGRAGGTINRSVQQGLRPLQNLGK